MKKNGKRKKFSVVGKVVWHVHVTDTKAWAEDYNYYVIAQTAGQAEKKALAAHRTTVEGAGRSYVESAERNCKIDA